MTLQTNRIYDVSMVNKEMVEIPKGKIELRDDRTKDEWTVEIEPFLLLKFPVTQDLYYEITKSHLVRLKGIDDLLKQLLGKTQYFSVIPYLAEQDLTLAIFLQ